MSRAHWKSLLLFVLGMAGCSHSAQDETKSRVPEPQAAIPAIPPPAPAPSLSPEVALTTFTDKLRWISQHFGVDLTPIRVSSMLGGSAQSTSPSRWSVPFDGTGQVEMQADALDAPVRWLEFSLARDYGLRFAELLPIYGENYRKIEGRKHGTDIFFEQPTAVQPGTRVAARLAARVAVPNAEVVELNLLRDASE